MRRLISLVILAAVAVPAAAQVTPPRRPPHDTAGDSGYGYLYRLGPGEAFSYEAFRRGRLGISVDLSADPATDSIGAKVGGVTPGGPADKAGVQAGDIIVALNGTRLAQAESVSTRQRRSGEEPFLVARSRPGTRLIELASRLNTGDTVRLDLRRGDRPVTATVVAGASGLEDFARRFSMQLRAPRTPTTIRVPDGEMFFDFPGAPLANLELVPVNAGLADYFGTSEGLLVVNAPRDSSLGLRSGDVILSIGGRKPESPAHAMRILGSYEPNETVTFDVMRMKHRVTVSGKMPERRGWRVMPNSFEFEPDLLPLLKGYQDLEPALEALPQLLRDLKIPPLPYVSLINRQVET